MTGFSTTICWLAVFAVLTGCTKPHRSPDASRITTAHPVGQSALPPLDADHARKLVLDTHLALDELRDRKFREGFENHTTKPLGECFGEEAYSLVEAADVVKVTQPYLQGSALDCYVASYFGCKIRDWYASAGIASSARGPSVAPHSGSKVTFIETTTTRIVADIEEALAEHVLADGTMDPDEFSPDTKYYFTTSRYTIELGEDGQWRISARKLPPDEHWQCGMGQSVLFK